MFSSTFPIKAGDKTPATVIAENDVKTDRSEETLKDRPSRKGKKKEKEPVEKPSTKSRIEKRLLVLPLDASVISLLLLIILGSFYVVCRFLSSCAEQLILAVTLVL